MSERILFAGTTTKPIHAEIPNKIGVIWFEGPPVNGIPPWFTIETREKLIDPVTGEVDFFFSYTEPTPVEERHLIYLPELLNPVLNSVATFERGFMPADTKTSDVAINQQYVDRNRPQSLPYVDLGNNLTGKVCNDLLPRPPHPVRISQSQIQISGDDLIVNPRAKITVSCNFSTYRTNTTGGFYSLWSEPEYYSCPRVADVVDVKLIGGSYYPLWYEWKPGVSYQKGDIVAMYLLGNNGFSNSYFICVEDHVSASSNWMWGVGSDNITTLPTTIFHLGTRYWNDFFPVTRFYPF